MKRILLIEDDPEIAHLLQLELGEAGYTVDWAPGGMSGLVRLREAVPEWFETDDDVPFMMQVFRIREERRKEIPAVTHVDGTGRLQTVTWAGNPRYARLISAFRDLTGVPIVLNTSFNENEPVVCKPEEAIDCFLRTRMDVLVLGDTLIQRQACN